MNDNELFEQARKRVQRKIKGKCITNKDVIIDQEKEILYYREKIQKMIEKAESKDNKIKPINTIKVEIDIEAGKALNNLETIKKKIKEINQLYKATDITSERYHLVCGCDIGQAKDYTIIDYYKNGELIKTQTIQYK